MDAGSNDYLIKDLMVTEVRRMVMMIIIMLMVFILVKNSGFQ